MQTAPPKILQLTVGCTDCMPSVALQGACSRQCTWFSHTHGACHTQALRTADKEVLTCCSALAGGFRRGGICGPPCSATSSPAAGPVCGGGWLLRTWCSNACRLRNFKAFQFVGDRSSGRHWGQLRPAGCSRITPGFCQAVLLAEWATYQHADVAVYHPGMYSSLAGKNSQDIANTACTA